LACWQKHDVTNRQLLGRSIIADAKLFKGISGCGFSIAA